MPAGEEMLALLHTRKQEHERCFVRRQDAMHTLAAAKHTMKMVQALVGRAASVVEVECCAKLLLDMVGVIHRANGLHDRLVGAHDTAARLVEQQEELIARADKEPQDAAAAEG